MAEEKVMDQDAVDEAVDQENEKKETEEVAVEEQLKALEEEVNTWKTDYYKVFADMENLKRRLQNEHANTMKFMMQSFIEQLLPVVDNFERSLTVENPSEEIKNFLKGYEMIYNQLKTLKKEDIFKENQDEVALLWRPHPLVKATVESMRPQLWIEYDRIVRKYQEEGWGIYDDSADLDRAIEISDAYYGDSSSVVQLYQQTGKPVMMQNVEMVE